MKHRWFVAGLLTAYLAGFAAFWAALWVINAGAGRHLPKRRTPSEDAGAKHHGKEWHLPDPLV